MSASNILTLRRYLDEHLAGSRIDVVSFDVFETLLFRRCHPSVVTHYIGRWLESRLRTENLQPKYNILDTRFSMFNNLASRNRELGYDHETVLADVVHEWLSELCPKGSPEQLRALAADVYAREVDVERMISYANEEMLALVKDLARRYRVIFMSDMYLRKSDILRLLDGNGYAGLFHDGYVSGEHRLLKRTGNLYKKVIESEGITFQRMIHLGDNVVSDHLVPNSMGILSMPYINYRQRRHYEITKVDGHCVDIDDAWKGHAIGTMASCDDLPDAPLPKKLGYSCFGPIYMSFLHSVAEHCYDNGIKKVYFLAREGYLLQKLFDQFVAWSSALKNAGIETRYCYVSRLTTYLASISTYGSREIELALDNTATPTLRNVFAPLGIDDATLTSIAERYGYHDIHHTLDEGFMGAEDFQLLLADRQLNSFIRTKTAKAKNDLCRYLQELQVFSQDKIAIVDVGWGGQIQYNIVTAFSGEPFPTVYGYYLATNRKARRRTTSTSLMTGVLSQDGSEQYLGNSVFEYVQCFEFIPRAPHGTVLGYEEVAGQARPIVRDDHEPSRAAEKSDDGSIALIQQGILQYDNAYLVGSMLYNAHAEDTLPYARQIAAEIMRYPPKEVARILLKFKNVHDLGMTSITEMSQLLSGHVRSPSQYYREFRQSLWKPGSLAISGGLLLQFLYAIAKYVVAYSKSMKDLANSRRDATEKNVHIDVIADVSDTARGGHMKVLDDIVRRNYHEAVRIAHENASGEHGGPLRTCFKRSGRYAVYLIIKSILMLFGKNVSWDGEPAWLTFRTELAVLRVSAILRLKLLLVRVLLPLTTFLRKTSRGKSADHMRRCE